VEKEESRSARGRVEAMQVDEVAIGRVPALHTHR
jgi:hypothetical protein